MSTGTQRLASVLGLAGAAALGQTVFAQVNNPTQWFVYNATLNGIPGLVARDNGFNANCKGWSWQQAGFLDGNGRPFDIDPVTNNIMNGMQLRGTRLAAGVYASAVADAGVADLSGGPRFRASTTACSPSPTTPSGGCTSAPTARFVA